MERVVKHFKSNVIAYLALFVALGGTSYAAVNLPANSVGSRQLRNGAVTGRKLAKHAVTAASLDPRSIAGHVAFWAQIAASGKVISSSPRATVRVPIPGRGVYDASWGRSIPNRCVAFANPAEAFPGTGTQTADTSGPFGGNSFDVETFDSTGGNVPETVNVLVLCP